MLESPNVYLYRIGNRRRTAYRCSEPLASIPLLHTHLLNYTTRNIPPSFHRRKHLSNSGRVSALVDHCQNADNVYTLRDVCFFELFTAHRDAGAGERAPFLDSCDGCLNAILSRVELCAGVDDASAYLFAV